MDKIEEQSPMHNSPKDLSATESPTIVVPIISNSRTLSKNLEPADIYFSPVGFSNEIKKSGPATFSSLVNVNLFSFKFQNNLFVFFYSRGIICIKSGESIRGNKSKIHQVLI